MSQTLKQKRALSLVKDFYTEERQKFIKSEESKLDRAKKFLGNRWVLHPDNAPVKGLYNQFGYRVTK